MRSGSRSSRLLTPPRALAAEPAVCGRHIVGSDRGQLGGAGSLAKLRDAEVAGGACALVQGAGVPAVAELIDPALLAGLGQELRQHRDGIGCEAVPGLRREDLRDPEQIVRPVAGK